MICDLGHVTLSCTLHPCVISSEKKKKRKKRNININLAILPSYDNKQSEKTCVMTWQNS